MITRKQFKQMFNNIGDNLGESNSPLWIPEQQEGGKKSRWFVKIRPICRANRKEFWMWCSRHCRGQVLCYSSSPRENEEWWGFTNRTDVVLFLLKWL